MCVNKTSDSKRVASAKFKGTGVQRRYSEGLVWEGLQKDQSFEEGDRHRRTDDAGVCRTQ